MSMDGREDSAPQSVERDPSLPPDQIAFEATLRVQQVHSAAGTQFVPVFTIQGRLAQLPACRTLEDAKADGVAFLLQATGADITLRQRRQR